MSPSLRRTLAASRRDLRLQWRQGFWLAYALVCLAYVLVLQLFGPGLRALLTTLVVFSDPSVLGFFFIGGLMLLERKEGTLVGGFASPLRVEEWMLAKLGSLTLLAVAAGFAIALPLCAGCVRPLWLLAAIVPTSTCFVLVGIIAGTRFSTVNRYLFGGGLLSMPLLLPMLAPLGVWDTPAFDLLPSGAALELLEIAFSQVRPLAVPAGVGHSPPLAVPAGYGHSPPLAVPAVRALLVLAVWNVLFWQWARTWMRRYVVAGAA
jgi:fluoroquinolone transport system permease protein